VTEGGPTRALARYATDLTFSQLPPDVVHQARRCLIDWLGVALGGASHESVAILMRYAELVGGLSQASVIGHQLRTSAPLAALINGQASHVLDFDDTFFSLETTLHGTSPIFPAAFAVGEWQRANGPDLLTAFVAGFEVAVRVALALGPAHYDAGWHVTGTAGRFGAAAAAGRLLGLSEVQLAIAFGLVATQAGGMKAVYGTMTKAHHAARAAHDGVVAALLAKEGFTSAPDAIEAKLGFLDLYTQGARPGELTEDLGARYAVLEDGFKPYPCGSLIHATIDATLEAISGRELTANQVVSVEAEVNQYVASVTGIAEPVDGLEAKFSAQHCVAVALAYGRGARLEDFEDSVVHDTGLTALRTRVKLIGDPDRPKDSAVVTVQLTDGSTLRADVPHASGSAERPMSNGEVEQKFLGLAEPALGDKTRALLDLTWHFDEALDAGALIKATTGA
jgi:2-methylcitrate dehydratase PrpD